ncbi:response regulator transcription factor [Acidimicrobiia bacterium EGI L10123]|uniref:response regulator transcription factor n=1 Tax=Salinilacustrithrix flava TaxID=2957203 RepID=UPI003D7C2EF2|nr:response regulator transcription factor [Acidimicrobiia bacterium EGI L10123]
MGERELLLLVEDDDDIRQGLAAVFSRAGYRVDQAGDGRAALRRFHEARPHLVVLDVGLPGLDGWEVLSRLRDMSDVPVLMLTARGLEAEKVRGLQGGADDYVAKPVGNQEIVARVGALLRRAGRGSEPVERYDDGTVAVDPSSHEVWVHGRPVHVTPTELRLLDTLVRHRGQVLSAEQLLGQAWRDPSGIGTDRVKYAVSRLRRKLDWSEDGPIEAVRGVGYRYRPPA